PCPMKFTTAELEKSRYRLPSAAHKNTPSPRTAEGKDLRNERCSRAERDEAMESATKGIIGRADGRCQKSPECWGGSGRPQPPCRQPRRKPGFRKGRFLIRCSTGLWIISFVTSSCIQVW